MADERHVDRSISSTLSANDQLAARDHITIVFWIGHTYNRRRRQRALGKLTTVKYELAFTIQDAAVAA